MSINENFTDYNTFNFTNYSELFSQDEFSWPQYGYLHDETEKIGKAIRNNSKEIL